MPGKRGRPKGSGGFDRLRQHERLRAMVAAAQDEMTAAQISNAKGIRFVMVRNAKTGKFERVGKDRVEAILADQKKGKGAGLEIVEVWEKDPSVHAFADLMDRVLGRPKHVVETEGEISLNISWKDAE